jgi:hypothetical protein
MSPAHVGCGLLTAARELKAPTHQPQRRPAADGRNVQGGFRMFLSLLYFYSCCW